MKKLLTKLSVFLIICTSIMPLTACSFNFYVNRSINGSAKEFANETSSILKSLVISKTINSDTGSTNDDIMKKSKNNTIINATAGKSLDNWGDLTNNWGVNEKIDTNGFNPDQFFVASGKGKLTTEVNNKNLINNILGYTKEITGIKLISNSILNALINNHILQGPIMTFLTNLQNNLKKSSVSMKMISNLIIHYSDQFLPAISQLMGNLVNGDWDISGQKTPSDLEQLKNFMINWKDTSSIQPYSAWVNGTNWDLNDAKTTALIVVTKGHNLDLWSQDDFNLYRGGSLINYLFWKISNDHHEIVNPVPLTPPHTAPRYLGDVLSDHIVNNNIDIDGLLKDISQFLPFLLTNPTYLLLIIEGVIPIIKKWILAMPDITFGVKHLTVGDIATSQTNKSFNLLDIANNIKTLVNDHSKLEAVIKKIIGWSDNDKTLDTFTYDIKLNINSPIGKINIPLGSVLNSSFISEDTKNSLVTSVVGFLTSSKGKNIVNVIIDFISQLNNQYPTGQHVDINLIKLTKFLTDENTGLLVILQETIETLKQIIDPKHNINPYDVNKLFYALGCQSDSNKGFKPNSPISVLQAQVGDIKSPLSNLLNIIIDHQNKKGLATIITNQNNNWINEHYNIYLNQKATISNITINEKTINNIQTIKVSYEFIYTSNDIIYHFVVNIVDKENLNTFQGMRNFKFKSITLL